MFERITFHQFQIAVFQVLPAGVERSGGDLCRDLEVHFGLKEGGISYGTFYTRIGRMTENGSINVRDDEDQDGRIRYYSLRPGGSRERDTKLDEGQLPGWEGFRPAFGV